MDHIRPPDKLTAEYRQKGMNHEHVITERLWRLINFLCCVHATNHVREMRRPPSADMMRVFAYWRKLSKRHYIFDCDFSHLSKLLKCITFVQDMNQSTRISEVLGDNAKYVVKNDLGLGKPIFTGSSEEGLALLGDTRSDHDDLRQPSYILNHDIDIMYESDKMIACEFDSFSFTQPVNAFGILNVLIRPGGKAGYVTLQKLLPRTVTKAINTECNRDPKSCHYSDLEMIKVCDIYPSPEQYVGQKCGLYYIMAMAFLQDCKKKFLPQRCSCTKYSEFGKLCEMCRTLTLKEMHQGENVLPTRVWSHSIRIKGPAIREIAVIENENVSDSLQEEENVDLVVKTKLNAGLFSSSGKKTLPLDHVPAIKCARWPSAAWEFTVRERPSGWPTAAVVQEIVAQGCHVIPRSATLSQKANLRQSFEILSSIDHMEWRLSFSVAEKILAASLNGVQVKCYLLLKALHEQVIEDLRSARGDGTYEELFNVEPFLADTYYLKSIFYWACEEIPLSEWKEDNLGRCFIKVLDKLIMFFEENEIPNYFIPTCDMIMPCPINPGIRITCVVEVGYIFKIYQDKTSEELFEVLHNCVSAIFCNSSLEVPPGNTKCDLSLINNALGVDASLRDLDSTFSTNSSNIGNQPFDDASTDSCSTAESTSQLLSVSSRSNVSNDAKFTGICSQPNKSCNADHGDGKYADSENGVPASPPQWSCTLNRVLAQIFAAKSKFLETHGNTYGKGFNTARALFYEIEARKLLPEGLSLDDLSLYELEEID